MFRKLRRKYYELTHPVIGEIWMLHRVTNIPSIQERLRRYEITPERLESLIVEHIKKGYEFISIAEMIDVKSRKISFSNKFISVTLDDGYADNYENAYPIFKKYCVPFCIYLCEKMVKGQMQEDAIDHYRFLSSEQLKVLIGEPLCTLGGHTASHVHLSQLTPICQREEIMHCKEWMESITGRTMADFAYPHGDYNEDTIRVVDELGIKRAVAAWGGGVRYDVAKLKVPRVIINI